MPSLCLGAAPDKLISGATGTGTTKSFNFSILATPIASGRTLVLQSVRTGPFTALKVDLEVSLNGGTTFQAVHAALDVYASAVTVTDCVPNALYRLNVTTFTNGTSCDVWGAAA